MSNQPENENQQTQTPEEIRQQLLAHVDASQKALEELSDEELEAVAGGSFWHTLDRIARIGGDIVGGTAKITVKLVK